MAISNPELVSGLEQVVIQILKEVRVLKRSGRNLKMMEN